MKLGRLSSPAPSMDAAKARKLEEYAAILEKQAQSAEASGSANEAANLYVKLIDILLLLARESQDHPTWLKYSSRAEALQKKTKEILASANNPTSGKGGGIKKILGLKPPEAKVEQKDKIVESPLSQIGQASLANPEQMIPKRLYDQMLDKNKVLESRLTSMIEKSEYDTLFARLRGAEEKLSLMPTLAEFEEQRRIIERSVPRVQYEELQKAILNLVPKDTYNSAQARILELETQLENSIPKSVLDNLANEVSLLVVTASIPMSQKEEPEVAQLPPVYQSQRQEVVSQEILLMKERLDMLELRMKSPRIETPELEE